MSINVTIGNPVHVRRARMVLSDLDQIKKNERDRRRRLRLEQVRQQSKEISNRLLERAKKIAKEEFSKLEKDGSELKQIHEKKIMEVQQKYQEELDDIGQAHTSAALQPDVDEIIEEEKKTDRVMALKRGKDAIERMRETSQKDTAEAAHQKRLREVREIENMRAAMIAKLSTPMSPGKKSKTHTEMNPSQDAINEENDHETLIPSRKNKTLRKSPRKIKKLNSKEHKQTLYILSKPGPSGLKRQVLKSPQKEIYKSDRTEHLIDDATDDQLPRGTVPTISTTPTKADKIARYNPEDYTQDISDSTSSISSSSSNSLSDDSSYFSDPAEQNICSKSIRTPLIDDSDKVQLYDCNMRQRNTYCRPLGIVQRIDIGNEPNAVQAAEAVKDAEKTKHHVCKSRILNAKRHGEDAILREKVRRDYQTLLRNLDYLTQEERKLKASQIPSNAEEDTHMLLHQRNKCHEERQKRMNRATKKVLDTYCTPAQYSHLTERVITSPQRRKCVTTCDVPHSTWQEEPPVVEEQTEVCYTECRRDKDSEMSREEQILDMLKKVERQKRLLLQEFGASLPDDIFNASIKSLFEDRPTQTRVSQAANAVRPLSPEIQVINMSNNEESAKKERKTKKVDKPSTKKIEIAVQTEADKPDRAENKSVQVELPQESSQKCKENTDIHSIHNKDTSVQVPHPLEPKVTIITPQTDDSSSNDSTSSENGMIIEIDEREVIVTPKKKRIGVKASKRPSPRIYQKIRSKSVSSKATSPIKRFSRSYSSSRLPSPQKKTKCVDTPDVASRKIDIHVSKSSFNDETDLSQETRVSIDASAESSQTISGTNGQDQTIESQLSGKPYRIRTRTKKWIRIKDTSDTTTSTSYASPPPIQPRSVFEALSNVTPILEMLDTPGAEQLRRLRHEVSPVSTPETPSPRTMMMPSNIPHRHRISRILRYSTESQTNGNNMLSSTRIDRATLTEPSDIQQQELAPPSEYLPALQPTKVCVCKNPTCKLLHTKFDDIHEYALKTCPEILQKYEDLQTLCTERIASLTDLIEKVRNEQRGMDLSLIIPSNETSLMQLPTSISAQTDEQAVRRLIESIEAVHAQLAKTLVESQKFIGSKSLSEDKSVQDEGIQATTSTPRSKLVDSVIADIQKKCKVMEGTVKPKIISDEKVNVKLNRFKMQQKPEATSATKVEEHDSQTLCTTLHENEEEATKETSFVPILTGIPKVSRNHGTVLTRPKPPITLLNGPYRPELESSGHELSTIVEFDTTDAINKSIKSPAKSKPSVHVAPLPIQQSNNFLELTDKTSDVKHSVEKETFAQSLQKAADIYSFPEKVNSMTDDIVTTKTETEQECMLDKFNKQLQCNTTAEESSSQAKDKLNSSENTDHIRHNNLHKDSKHKTTSTSLFSFSGLSGISEITSSPSSDLKNASSPEEMEAALTKLGLGWAVTTLKKTREASALSSSSNSDITPVNTARRMISPTKKHHDPSGLLDISDVSSISIKEASKSTEQVVLLKGRTSTPKLQNSNSNSERSNTTNSSGSIQDASDSLTVPNVSLTKTKSDNKQLQSF
ncbi:uncharacterized protein LOC109859220 isoform X2 [Pseudomyrmex gracilis]|uniref:uncharacterized protein LOC109859220 isoform X2 n=1 Tax=Pseudomyrmex gracilis TaxID=219809 RepID=UPI00099570C8|nr:uncharacterized protein LOC109859220 isoform X2 [Pseudomyrmex gracilis]